MGKIKLDLEPMSAKYTPSTVLFAENLNDSFNTLSQLLYGVIDGIVTIYGNSDQDTYNGNWDASTGRNTVKQYITDTLTRSLFQRNTGFVKLTLNNDNIDTIVGGTGEHIISANQIKSIVSINSYVDITNGTIAINVPNARIGLTSTGNDAGIAATFKTNSFISISENKITLKPTSTYSIVLNDDTNNNFIFNLNNKIFQMTKDGDFTISRNLIVNGENATVNGGRLIHSPATSTSGTNLQVNSIWYDSSNRTLWFN